MMVSSTARLFMTGSDAGHAEADRANRAVRRRVQRRRGAGAEHLAVCQQLGVDFEADNGLVTDGGNVITVMPV